MKKVRIQDLIGPWLDYAVAKSMSRTTKMCKDTNKCMIGIGKTPEGDISWMPFLPSSKWSYGGPIIDSENISIKSTTFAEERAYQIACYASNAIEKYNSFGPTKLVAAMRAFVRSRTEGAMFVDLPDEANVETEEDKSLVTEASK